MIWYILKPSGRVFDLEFAQTFASFDLAISALLYAAIILMGQAFVVYEVSTEKTLPRRQFKLQWKRTIILATGLGGIVGISIVYNLSSINSLILTILLLTTLYAFHTWQLIIERERFTRYLRPFVSRKHLYENLLETTPSIRSDLFLPFRTLCVEVLRAKSAHLIPTGSLAPMIGPGLDFPIDNKLEEAPYSSTTLL